MMDSNSNHMKMLVGNEYFHTDSTYKPLSSKAALLSCMVAPSRGGGTAFVDMRAAYDALDEAMKMRVSTLSAYHSNLYSQANDLSHFPPVDAQTIYHPEAYLRPLIKTHPVTGRKSLFLGRHAFGIPGLSRDESRQLLAHLLDFSCSEERVHEHSWQKGDLVVWDNRCLLHRALPWDYNEPRILLGTRIQGEPDSEMYLAHRPEAADGRRVLAAEMDLLRKAAGLSPAEADAASVRRARL
eukprot:gnl/TRDRNA2_/TRDRNA2_133202_c0_seq2.p1 gnl/TRDRNA2_/TRDRNA2_133202_c0~~gnl/TRDRNA2_/TRDRNA2_133202_c0_seq2.p1  ORF type:complete len:240 (+),score=24.86 gnl/TRDRNA2_/TRDRNA2_133202_c0_seq2:76-795(+)